MDGHERPAHRVPANSEVLRVGKLTIAEGIFDRSALGKTVEPVTVAVERGAIRAFARVLGCQDAVHYDVSAARDAGHADLVAPPSFFMAIETQADEQRRRANLPSVFDLIRTDFRYLLHGEERYFYGAPIYAGEDVVISSSVIGFYDKIERAMEFATIQSSVCQPARGLLVRSERVLLHRLPAREPCA